MKDFFFGEINTTEEATYELSLNKINNLGRMVSLDFFKTQLKRILLESNQLIDLKSSSSSPSFRKLVALLPIDEIGIIKINRRTDVISTVEETLDCSIYFADGIIRITAHWCFWKEERENQVVDTLLKPLFENDLIKKTFYKTPNGNISPLSLEKTTAFQQLFMQTSWN